MILKQKLVILFCHKETCNQFIIFSKPTLSILLLQEHIRGVKSGKSFFSSISSLVIFYGGHIGLVNSARGPMDLLL